MLPSSYPFCFLFVWPWVWHLNGTTVFVFCIYLILGVMPLTLIPDVAQFKIAFLWCWTYSWAVECYPACTGFWIQSPAWKMRKRKLILQLDRSSCSTPVMLCLFLLSVGTVLLVPLLVVRNVVNMNEYTPRSTAGCGNSMRGLFLRDYYYCFHNNLQFITFRKAMLKHFCCSTFLLTPIFNFHLFCGFYFV